MSEHDSEHRTVTLTRVFDAPIDLVYRAWAGAEHVALEVENWVPAAGTEFRTHMSQPGVFETRGTGRTT